MAMADQQSLIPYHHSRDIDALDKLRDPSTSLGMTKRWGGKIAKE
jgi:hypothetical protein